MRSRRPRIHLLDVSDPVDTWSGLIVRCQRVIRNGKPKFMAESSYQNWLVLPLNTCRKCVGLPPGLTPEQFEKPHFMYGVVEAQEELEGLIVEEEEITAA